MAIILHILPSDDWATAQKAGSYRAASLETEGFIHFSDVSQVLKVAAFFYQDLPDLKLLVVDTDKLSAPLKREAPAMLADEPQPDQIFPHLYGALNLDAVIQVLDFGKDTSGQFILPPELQGLEG